ncbi:MAG: hypothetical protein HQ528_00310 [Candidatus Marinimicrobia bacterium]|nr:hypothetical protein [Candidatus Neomarinimicrobiota bacterium]
MKRILIFTILCGLLFGEDYGNLSKLEYYNKYIAPQRGLEPLSMGKTMGFGDRKRSVLNVGNMVLRLSNAATLGYDRWGLNHEFPAGSMQKDGCCTYYWTMSPIVGALVNGQPSVAVGTRGAGRGSEEEFEPLPGYDAGFVDTEANIGIAFSDKPESWPALWPIELDPSGTYTDALTGESFPGIESQLGDGFPDAPCGLGIQADREAYFVVTDNDPDEGNTFESNGVGPLNVRFDVWVLNYSSTFGNDGLVFIQLMTNVGADTLKDLYMGVAGDPDTPEQGGAEWTDDYSMFIEADDPHIAEKLSDTTDAYLLENFALVWDGDDQAEGFKSSGIGWIGLKFLECTKIDNDGIRTSYDVSSVYTYEYSQEAQTDAQAYNEQLKSGIQTPHNITPAALDIQKKPYSYGPDITWVIASGPMDLAPGEQVIFTFADFMGIDETDLIRNAKVFQSLYDNNCSNPKPPLPTPNVHAIADDGKVTLFWDADSTEIKPDPVTRNLAFEGYRIYRSTDRGKTWGNVITDINGNPTDIYQPISMFDKHRDVVLLKDGTYLEGAITSVIDMDDILASNFDSLIFNVADGDEVVLDTSTINLVNINTSGSHPMTDPLAYYNLGTDSGLRYSFVDNSVVNGYEYWYSVCAYDHQDNWVGAPVDPLENSRAKNAFIVGDNTVAVIPQASPAGYEQENSQIVHVAGNSDARLTATYIDPSNYEFIRDAELNTDDFISKGHDYEVTFKSIGDSINYWVMEDLDDNDTVINMETDIESGAFQYVIDGFIPLFENAYWTIDNEDTAFTIQDSDTSTEVLFGGVGIGGIDNTWYGFYKDLADNYGFPQPTGKPQLSDLQKDLEYRFTAEGSIASYYNNPILLGSQPIDTIIVPFELWTVEDEPVRINVALYQVVGNTKPESFYELADSLDSYIFTANVVFIPIYEPYNESQVYHFANDAGLTGWASKINKEFTQFEYGNIIRVNFTNPVLPGIDKYTISTVVPDFKVEKDDLDSILVVPNPYIVTSVYETNVEVKEIQFTHLPDNCVIRIFNIAGELVKIIQHNPESDGYRGPSTEAWNLRTYNDQEISFGVYLFHVMADGQEKTGKFAVIK